MKRTTKYMALADYRDTRNGPLEEVPAAEEY